MKNLAQNTVIGGYSPALVWVDASWTTLRVPAGLFMAFGHGLGKVPPSGDFTGMVEGLGFPVPVLFAWLAGLAEFLGGLLLAAGALTRVSAFSIFATMFVAAFISHAGDPFGDRESALLFGVIMIPFMIAGSGRFSVDRFLRNRL